MTKRNVIALIITCVSLYLLYLKVFGFLIYIFDQLMYSKFGAYNGLDIKLFYIIQQCIMISVLLIILFFRDFFSKVIYPRDQSINEIITFSSSEVFSLIIIIIGLLFIVTSFPWLIKVIIEIWQKGMPIEAYKRSPIEKRISELVAITLKISIGILLIYFGISLW